MKSKVVSSESYRRTALVVRLIFVFTLTFSCTGTQERESREVTFKVYQSYGREVLYEIKLRKDEVTCQAFHLAGEGVEYHQKLLAAPELDSAYQLINNVEKRDDLEPQSHWHHKRFDLYIDSVLYSRDIVRRIDLLPKDVGQLLIYLMKDSGMTIGF